MKQQRRPGLSIRSKRFWIGRSRRSRQLQFAFIERAASLDRLFKRSILFGLTLVVAAMLTGLPAGRYAAGWVWSKGKHGVLWSLGRSTGREAIDHDWRRKREFDVATGLGKFRASFAVMKPPMQDLFRFGGLDPDRVVLRWGNFDRTLLLPSKVFEPDDTGRSYRLRPNTRSVWVRTLRPVAGLPTFFLVPDEPGLVSVLKPASTEIIERSGQSTNSWGLRGGEFDLSAQVRGIVLGDSFLQGILIADDETPPECLRRDLEARLETKVAVLNTGHIGYSPEQCYYTLLEYADRVRPAFVVLGLFANDFGELFEVLDGQGDWDEGRYWVRLIQDYCRDHGIVCLTVPAPFSGQVEDNRKAAWYPGQVSDLGGRTSTHYLDPIEAFVDAQIDLQTTARRQGRNARPSPLFNGRYGDGHFSALGSKVWAEAVGARLVRLLELEKAETAKGEPRPRPHEAPASTACSDRAAGRR